MPNRRIHKKRRYNAAFPSLQRAFSKPTKFTGVRFFLTPRYHEVSELQKYKVDLMDKVRELAKVLP